MHLYTVYKIYHLIDISASNIHLHDGIRGNPRLAANIMHMGFMRLCRTVFKRTILACLLTDNEICLRMSNHTMYIIRWFPRYNIANVACTDIHAWIRLCILRWADFWPAIKPWSAASDKRAFEPFQSSGYGILQQDTHWLWCGHYQGKSLRSKWARRDVHHVATGVLISP